MSFRYTYSINNNFCGVVPDFTNLFTSVENNVSIKSPLICIVVDEVNFDLFSFVFSSELTESELLELNSICVPKSYGVNFYADVNSTVVKTDLIQQGTVTLSDLVPYPKAGSGIFVFSSGYVSISGDTYFIGQGNATSTGSLTQQKFPNSDIRTISNFGSMSVVVGAPGTVVSISAVVKNPTGDATYDVYIAALDVNQSKIRLLNSSSPISISAKNPFGSIKLNEVVDHCETLAPWVEANGTDLNRGISITVNFIA
jgi:hypothetical protein